MTSSSPPPAGQPADRSGVDDAATCSFEAGIARLEKIVEEIEDGKIGITEALEKYEQGVRYLKRCTQLLEAAERKVELLSGLDGAGQAVTQPFDDKDLTLAEKAQQRARRRSRPGAGEDSASTDLSKGSEDSSIDGPATLF